MRQTFTKLRAGILFFFFFLLIYTANAQAPGPVPDSGQTDIRHYAVYADGTGSRLPDSTQYGVQLGRNITVNGGAVGSNFYIGIRANNIINGWVYSGNRIWIDTGNTILGSIVARNDFGSQTPAITVSRENNILGSGTLSTRGLLSGGHVRIPLNNSVYGPVYMQRPYTYNGPNPQVDSVHDLAQLEMPLMPALPTPVSFPAPGTTSITTTTTLSPGVYNELALTGGQAVTFSAPGTYVFWTIRNKGTNKLDFLIPPGSTGTYKIYVHNDADMGNLQVNVNGVAPTAGAAPEAGMIYMEIHGTGDTQGGDAFLLHDVSGAPANWLGTLYAANGRIRMGSGGNTLVQGAVWSRHRVIIGDNTKIYYVPLNNAAEVFIDPYYPPPPGGKVDTNNDKIGAELFSLSTSPDPTPPLEGDNDIFQVEGDKVWIEVIAVQGSEDALLTTLKEKGLTEVIQNEPGSQVITGLFPISRLTELNTVETIDYARPLFEPVTKSGAVMTEGAATMKADLVAAGFPAVRGEGIKIGVISDSYDRSSTTIQYAPLDIEAGELPGPGNAVNPEAVQVLLDFPYGLKSDEGRAMLQIVHDVAPKAKLAFRTGFVSAGDFANGIRRLADPSLPGGRCNVIVDDVSYITEPFFNDGVIAGAVDEVVANGVTYVTSAGNFGARSYESRFSPTSVSGLSGQVHSFGADGAYQPLTLKAGTYTIVLQWEDRFYSLGGEGNTGADKDLDIFITDAAGNVLFGFNRDNIGLDPYEVLPFVVNSDLEARLLIVRANARPGASANFRLKYIVFRGNALIRNNSGVTATIVGQANARGAISVGAMLYKNPLQIAGYPIETLPADFSYPSVASFSSRGGTVISGETTDRQKPDVVAPNGVNTTVPLGTTDIDGDGRINFFGTSASAPHVAALAGLLIQARKTYTNTEMTPVDVRALLTSTATSLSGLPGHNTTSGFGLTNADAAMRTFANPQPTLQSLHTIDPAHPEVLLPVPNPFPVGAITLAAKGVNLSATTKIFVNGAEVATTPISNEVVSATVTVADPNTVRIKLYTAPKGETGLDGGYSNELQGLYATTKKTVDIRVTNGMRKFGEANPVFSALITVDGAPVPAELRTYLKLNTITYHTTATSTSPAYVYPITASIAFTDADATLLSKYQYNFFPGALTVGKLPVKITPVDQAMRLGEYREVNYTYDFGTTNIDPTIDLVAITAAKHRQQVATSALAVMHNYASASITEADLHNKSGMVSYQALRNARKFLLNGTFLVPAPANPSPAQAAAQKYLVDVAAQSFIAYRRDPYHLSLTPAYSGGPRRGLLNSRDIAAGNVTTTLTSGQLMTISNGDLLNLTNGQLMTISNGVYVLVDGSLVEVLSVTINESGEVKATLANGQLMTISNTELIILSNGQLMTISNGQLMTISNGQLMTISNGQLMTISNGELFIVVNGEIQFVDSVEVTADGQVNAYLSNGQLMTISNGQLMTISNGQLMTISNTELVALSNGQLMTISNGEDLLALSNGQLMTISNNLSVGSGSSNTGALVVVDENDVSLQGGALGGVVPVNLITGMEAGTQKLVPATFVNDNYDISYGLGTVTIVAPAVTLKASDPVPVNSIAVVKATYAAGATFNSWQHSIKQDSVRHSDKDSLNAINATPAVYPVALNYTDVVGPFTTPNTYLVFYDPTLSFVTGAGAINSPVYFGVPYMGVEGIAQFGFVSKYVKGKTEPTGNTQFEFQAGGLSFRSSTYQWLVVSGARAQFKGTGTINGSGNYGFLLTAVDGVLLGSSQPDRFRIKIWEVGTGRIVYDNLYGFDDNADLANSEFTRLVSGSVVIHTVSTKKTTTTTAREASLPEDAYSGPLKVAASPNPTRHYFTLVLQSSSKEPLTLTVTDIMGRVVERRSGLGANGVLRLGDRYESGIYLVEVQQGGERRLLRLVKTNK